MFAWYWLADLCEDDSIPFTLGHALYMRAVSGQARRAGGRLAPAESARPGLFHSGTRKARRADGTVLLRRPSGPEHKQQISAPPASRTRPGLPIRRPYRPEKPARIGPTHMAVWCRLDLSPLSPPGERGWG
jgi:hypothetical protein